MEFLQTSCIKNVFQIPRKKYKYWVTFIFQGSHIPYKTIQTDSYEDIESMISFKYCMNSKPQKEYPEKPCIIELSRGIPVLISELYDQPYNQDIMYSCYSTGLQFLGWDFPWDELRRLIDNGFNNRYKLKFVTPIRFDYYITYQYHRRIRSIHEFGRYLHVNLHGLSEYPKLLKIISN
jgi:hypothetical protein